MSADHRSPDSRPQKRVSLVDELQALIHSLQTLYLQISSRLLYSRMVTKSEPTASRESPQIQDLLANRINRAAATSEETARADTEKEPALTVPASTGGSIPPTGARDPGHTRPTLFNALSGYFTRRRSSVHFHPFMREKMQANTLEHINKALALARQGHAQGARIHAELAESAMKTAGEYMSDDEYHRFRDDVETRLHGAQEVDGAGSVT